MVLVIIAMFVYAIASCAKIAVRRFRWATITGQ
jgi:hypothetical protein